MVESKEDSNAEINQKVGEISLENKKAKEIFKEIETSVQEETKTKPN